jgi:hypothetical protein
MSRRHLTQRGSPVVVGLRPTARGVSDATLFTALTRAELSFAHQNAKRSEDGRESRTLRESDHTQDLG